MNVFWFIFMYGDSCYFGMVEGVCVVDYDYFK